MRVHYFTLLILLFCSSAFVSCREVYDKSERGEGELNVYVYGEEFVEQGIPSESMIDGWSVTFSHFVVTLAVRSAHVPPHRSRRRPRDGHMRPCAVYFTRQPPRGVLSSELSHHVARFPRGANCFRIRRTGSRRRGKSTLLAVRGRAMERDRPDDHSLRFCLLNGDG